MTDYSVSNKRLAKNTLLLYFRMLLLMIINLYTSRVLLKTLGVDDYGIYNVVGGCVAAFTIISGSLSAAISRFITFDIGRGDKSKLNGVFSTALTIQSLISLVFLVVAELIGVWFLNSKMNIPLARMAAANWVLQFSILTFVVNLVNVPFHASIIAYERMFFYAWESIAKGLCILGIAFSIPYSPVDKLVFYSLLMLIVDLMVFLANTLYCRSNFSECRLSFRVDGRMLKNMFGFAGWNFIGSSSSILRDHGGNILLNLFFNTVINASRGISMDVHKAVTAFSSSFTTALNPQITKSFAIGDYQRCYSLVLYGAKFSYYLQMLVCIPLLLNTSYVLHLWLGDVPSQAVSFVQLILIFGMLEVISSPLITLMLATGDIKKYQITVGGIQLLNLPISYIFLSKGLPPETVFCISIVLSQLCLFARLILLNQMVQFSSRLFLKNVYLNAILVSLISFLLPWFINNQMHESLLRLIVVSLLSIIISCAVVLCIGCTPQERIIIFKKISSLKEKVINTDR